MKKKMIMIVTAITLTMTGCDQTADILTESSTETTRVATQTADAKPNGTKGSLSSVSSNRNKDDGQNNDNVSGSSKGALVFSDINADDLLTERDMLDSPDMSGATELTVTDGNDTVIDKEGTYILSGKAKNATVIVDADDQDKIQLVLNGLNITNSDSPCIYVKSADKVFITTISKDNELKVSGTFSVDGDTNTDAAIFSKDDLTLNGTGSLTVSSSDNGITSKDSLKITGGSLKIESEGNAFEAHDAVIIASGKLEITECNDGIHAEDKDDDTEGFVYISGGSISINAKDDAIHATTIVKIDGGELVLAGSEGIEGTDIQINDGDIDINASDDGINAAHKSSALSPLFELNGGNVTIAIGAGDTDGVDSNGDIRINGGKINITGQSTFDCDGNAEYNGGIIIENGKETNTISNQMMGGHGGMGSRGMRNESTMNGKQRGMRKFDGTQPQDEKMKENGKRQADLNEK